MSNNNRKGVIQVNTWVKAIENYVPLDDKGLAFKMGDIFLVSQMDAKMSGYATLGGKKGWFPMEHVVETEQRPAPTTSPSPLTVKTAQNKNHFSMQRRLSTFLT